MFRSRSLTKWTCLDNLVTKNYNEATKQKQRIEQAQRDLAAERKKSGAECVCNVDLSRFHNLIGRCYLPLRFVPVFFESDISSGAPKLTAEGRKAVEEEVKLQP